MNIIQTKRLIIREYSMNDVLELSAILSDPITMSFWPSPFTLQQTENWINDNMERYNELGFGCYCQQKFLKNRIENSPL